MTKALKRLFYPYSGNNYKAAVLQPSGLSLLIALFLLLQSFFNLSLGIAPGVLGFASDITPEEIVVLTNQERVSNGLAQLTLNSQLSEAAQQKAADMFALDYWAHISPRGVDPWYFVLNAGYHYRYAGENLARDFSHASEAVTTWMASPTHRENVLNEKYQEIGVAVVDGILQGRETTLVVQMFGTPQTGQPEVIAGQPETGVKEAVALETSPAAVISETSQIENQPGLLNGFSFSQGLGLAFAILLLIILAFDGWIVYRQKASRIAGHNYIHATFVIILIAMMLLSQRGAIL